MKCDSCQEEGATGSNPECWKCINENREFLDKQRWKKYQKDEVTKHD